MPKPLAICIEDLQAEGTAPRYLQCVATVGDEPGLTLDATGRVLWQEPGGSCELWVSGDDRLMLLRPEGAPEASLVVSRRGRSLEVPVGQPVVLRDQDELTIGARTLRIHVHGVAPQISEPTVFVPAAPRSGLAQAAKATATALALTAAMGLAGPTTAQASSVDDGDIEVRSAPPKIARPRPPKDPKKPPKDPKDPKKPGKKKRTKKK